MCTSPIQIKNPNKGSSIAATYFKDSTSTYLNIPCGKCAECKQKKELGLIQRLDMHTLHTWNFMLSITYNEDMIPRMKVNDYNIKYADVSDFQHMIKRCRIHYPKIFKDRHMTYFAVSEMGSLKGRPHFHAIIFLDRFDSDTFLDAAQLEHSLFDIFLKEWSRNIGSDKIPIYKPCCTYIRKYVRGKLQTTYDLHLIVDRNGSEGTSDVAFYVMKYLFKSNDHEKKLQYALRTNLDKESYRKVWNKIKPRYFKSIDFGKSKTSEVSDYINHCIQAGKSNFPYPIFINPITGQTFPLSKYYRQKFLDYPNAWFYFDKTHDKNEDGFIYSEPREVNFFKSKLLKNQKLDLYLQRKTDLFEELFDSNELTNVNLPDEEACFFEPIEPEEDW